VSRRNVTIQDIAELAGVSTATVSRALSAPQQVTPRTRAAVMDAVRQTGYQINRTARNLRLKRTGSVLALVPDLANPFFSEILAGIASVLSPAGFGLLVADTIAGPDPLKNLNDVLERGLADGMVVFDGRLIGDARMGQPGVPVVAACEWGELDLPWVRIDNEAAAALAIDHLVDMGHRSIGHVTGPEGNVLTRTRLEGTRKALQRHGLSLPGDWTFAGDFSLASGAKAARAWLALDERPSALFCASDQMACGLIGELCRHGISVPEDVSVIGFDDIDIAAHLTPALTTVRQPRHFIGEQAARMLVSLVDDGEPPSGRTLIPVELVKRASVAAHASTVSPARRSRRLEASTN
jgi:LacI family transcriptional regulator, repressor for deo operon, udp, cdd, tsx, nupC, and nupG